MSAPVYYFGIRHHGPGCARSLEAALDELKPETVLIEGPTDASELLPLLGEKEMIPPVALLAYVTNDPNYASFWPFAVYSPEYRAIRHALSRGIPVNFIDLPASAVLCDRMPRSADAALQPHEKEDSDSCDESESSNGDTLLDNSHAPSDFAKDPIGKLAEAAGYDDGESWWSNLIEENPSPGPVFEAIASAMTTIRSYAQVDLSRGCPS